MDGEQSLWPTGPRPPRWDCCPVGSGRLDLVCENCRKRHIGSAWWMRSSEDRFISGLVIGVLVTAIVLSLAGAIDLKIDERGQILPRPIALHFGPFDLVWPLASAIGVFAFVSIDNLMRGYGRHRLAVRAGTWPVALVSASLSVGLIPVAAMPLIGFLGFLASAAIAVAISVPWALRQRLPAPAPDRITFAGATQVAIASASAWVIAPVVWNPTAATVQGAAAIAWWFAVVAVGRIAVKRLLDSAPRWPMRQLSAPRLSAPQAWPIPVLGAIVRVALGVTVAVANAGIAVAIFLADSIFRISRYFALLALDIARSLYSTGVDWWSLGSKSAVAVTRLAMALPALAVALCALSWFSAQAIHAYVWDLSLGGPVIGLADNGTLIVGLFVAGGLVVAVSGLEQPGYAIGALSRFAENPLGYWIVASLVEAALLSRIPVPPYGLGPVTAFMVVLVVGSFLWGWLFGGWRFGRPVAEGEAGDAHAKPLIRGFVVQGLAILAVVGMGAAAVALLIFAASWIVGFAGGLLSGEAPAASTAAQAQPSSQAPTPTPRQVTLRPEQLIMPLSELPSGYTTRLDKKITDTGARVASFPGASGWERQFEAQSGKADYGAFFFSVWVYPETAASAAINKAACDSQFAAPPLSSHEITVDVIGVAAKGCEYDFASSESYPVNLTYTTGTRNVLVHIGLWPSRTVQTSTAISRMIALARQQLAIIDRVSPP